LQKGKHARGLPALGRYWAGRLRVQPLSRGPLGLLGRVVAVGLFPFSKMFSNLVSAATCKFKKELCRSPKILKPILLDF
jgi:hypothetical protein